MRLTALAVFLAVLLVGMVGLTLKAIRPYHQASVEADRLAAVRRQVAGLDRSNDALRRQIVNLRTPDGVAVEAHKMGYFRPGETPLNILGVAAPSETSQPTQSAPASAAPGAAPLLGRFWRHLLDL